MVTTRRQSRGESNEQHEVSPAVASGLKRGRTTGSPTTVRKRTRLSDNHEPPEHTVAHSSEEVPMSGAPPPEAIVSQVEGPDEDKIKQKVGMRENGQITQIPIATGGEERTDKENEPLLFHQAQVEVTTNGTGHAKHKRFDSEEPLDAPVEIPLAKEQVALPQQSEQDNDSDEDAPEDITAADAQVQSRLAKAEASYAAEQQKLKSKRRRQEQDARLKKQSKPAAEKWSLTSGAPFPEAVLQQDGITVNQLPELLPDSILEEAPEVRSPTLEPESIKSRTRPIKTVARRKVILDQHPEDIQVGPVNVRVLETVNRHLPPIANKKSRALRDNWLAGKRGNNSVFSRRKRVGANSGFLRS